MTPKSLVQSTHTLFSLPDVVIRVNQLIGDPDTQTADLAEAILCDPGLAARLLRLVNSAYYGSRRRVETISHAIVLLGHRELRDLMVATVTANLFEGLPPEQVNMDRFWQHSIMCGIAARGLAQRHRLREGERFFTAGLLHGVGKLILYSQYPERYRKVLQLAGDNEQARVVAERQVFGFTYAELSAELLKSWRLLESLHVAIAYHLEPSKAPDYRLEATILHVAVQIVNRMQTGANDTPSTAQAEPTPEDFAPLASLLGLLPESLASLPAEIDLHARELFQIIRSEAKPV